MHRDAMVSNAYQRRSEISLNQFVTSIGRLMQKSNF